MDNSENVCLHFGHFFQMILFSRHRHFSSIVLFLTQSLLLQRSKLSSLLESHPR